MEPVRVIRSDAMQGAPTTHGGTRDMAKINDIVSVSKVRNRPQTTTGWHHHGAHTAYAYVAEGQLRIEWGPGGRESIELATGDFYVISPNTVHREVNPGSSQNCLVGFFTGTGPRVVNRDGPEPDKA